MTAIAWKDGLLAVDCLATCGSAHRLVQSKAAVIKGWVVVGCGSLLDTEKIHRVFEKLDGDWDGEKKIAEHEWPPLKDQDSVVIFWRPNVAVILRSDCHPEINYQRMDAFAASSFLLGAMHAGSTAIQAVASACWHVHGCGFPVEVYGWNDGNMPGLIRVVGAMETSTPEVTKSGAIMKPPMLKVDPDAAVIAGIEPGDVIWGNNTIDPELAERLTKEGPKHV